MMMSQFSSCFLNFFLKMDIKKLGQEKRKFQGPHVPQNSVVRCPTRPKVWIDRTTRLFTAGPLQMSRARSTLPGGEQVAQGKCLYCTDVSAGDHMETRAGEPSAEPPTWKNNTPHKESYC